MVAEDFRPSHSTEGQARSVCCTSFFQHSQKDHVPFRTEDLFKEPQLTRGTILKSKQAMFNASEDFDKIRLATGVTDAEVRLLHVLLLSRAAPRLGGPDAWGGG